LDAVSNEENHESILTLEVPHPIKESITIKKPIFDFIEPWLQSIVGKKNAIRFSTHLVHFFSSAH
jgi:hypothetical protein